MRSDVHTRAWSRDSETVLNPHSLTRLERIVILRAKISRGCVPKYPFAEKELLVISPKLCYVSNVVIPRHLHSTELSTLWIYGSCRTEKVSHLWLGFGLYSLRQPYWRPKKSEGIVRSDFWKITLWHMNGWTQECSKAQWLGNVQDVAALLNGLSKSFVPKKSQISVELNRPVLRHDCIL
jgi:hypothetical protein